MLVWPEAVPLDGLYTLWTGFSAADAQTYNGPAEEDPWHAAEEQWTSIRSFDRLPNRYASDLGANVLGFGRTVTARAIRLRITAPRSEDHPHLGGKTFGGRRVWLGELLALRPLGNAPLESALPAATTTTDIHPPDRRTLYTS